MTPNLRTATTHAPRTTTAEDTTGNTTEGTTTAGLVTWWVNHRDRSWSCADAPSDVVAFHRGLPGYAPTPLVELATLAAELGVGRLFVKDESQRLGLPAFKALGASWAVHRALEQRDDPSPALLVTATDGNHGRAVARAARQLGQHAHVVVAAGVHPDAVQAIRDEGARVTAAPGTYDDAVALAIEAAKEPGAVLVQDMSWPGYEQIPGWIVEGYATLVREVDEQLSAAGASAPDAVLIPVGVGSLAQAVVTHYRSRTDPAATRLVTVEPESAACVLASLRAGDSVSVPTSTTPMAGLNCGTVSEGAWPYLHDGIDAAVAVADDDALRAAADLHRLGVPAGPCGAASLAAARRALTGSGSAQRRDDLGIDADSVVVLLSTEGAAANPAHNERVEDSL